MARAGSFVHNLTQPPDWFRPGGHDLFRVSRWGHGIFSDEIRLSCFLMLQCHNVQTECPSSYHLAQVLVYIFLQDKCHRDDLKRVRMHKTRTMGPCVAAFDHEASEDEYSGQGGEYLRWLVTLFSGVQERSERPELSKRAEHSEQCFEHF